jgi:predicted nucleic acid-binding protein
VILYLDTSNLVKLYVEEPGSPAVQTEVEASELVTTSIVAYAEARAALARRRREGSLTAAEHRKAKAGLEADWPRVLTAGVTESLTKRAGDLAERQRLRGFDALHLATYLTVVQEFPGEQVQFSTADLALDRAARRTARRLPARRG